MYKWILGIVVGLSVIASLAVIKFGLKPKPIPIIKASNFVEPEKLGVYINRQLYQRLRQSSPIVFGYDKNNPFEVKVVNAVIESITNDHHDKLPEFVLLTPDESFSGSDSSKQDEVKTRYGDKILSFTVVNLKDTVEAPEIINCENDHHYSIWLDCIKKQKVRQMGKAKKVDLTKPVAIVENQSQKDVMIYIRQ